MPEAAIRPKQISDFPFKIVNSPPPGVIDYFKGEPVTYTNVRAAPSPTLWIDAMIGELHGFAANNAFLDCLSPLNWVQKYNTTQFGKVVQRQYQSYLISKSFAERRYRKHSRFLAN